MSTIVSHGAHPHNGRSMLGRLIEFMALLDAARKCANSVQEGRRPSPEVLQTLGISERSIDTLGLAK